MQHIDGKIITQKFLRINQICFEMIMSYYTTKNKNLKFYNLKFYESFSEEDYEKN